MRGSMSVTGGARSDLEQNWACAGGRDLNAMASDMRYKHHLVRLRNVYTNPTAVMVDNQPPEVWQRHIDSTQHLVDAAAAAAGGAGKKDGAGAPLPGEPQAAPLHQQHYAVQRAAHPKHRRAARAKEVKRNRRREQEWRQDFVNDHSLVPPLPTSVADASGGGRSRSPQPQQHPPHGNETSPSGLMNRGAPSRAHLHAVEEALAALPPDRHSLQLSAGQADIFDAFIDMLSELDTFVRAHVVERAFREASASSVLHQYGGVDG